MTVNLKVMLKYPRDICFDLPPEWCTLNRHRSVCRILFIKVFLGCIMIVNKDVVELLQIMYANSVLTFMEGMKLRESIV